MEFEREQKKSSSSDWWIASMDVYWSIDKCEGMFDETNEEEKKTPKKFQYWLLRVENYCLVLLSVLSSSCVR